MKKVPPCSECPYRLGLIQTVKNPCPQCELEGYRTFERFNNMLKNATANQFPNIHRDPDFSPGSK